MAPSRRRYRSIAAADQAVLRRVPTTTRVRVRVLGPAPRRAPSTRKTSPLRTSALEVVTIRPGTSRHGGIRREDRVSAPTWTTLIRSRRTPRWSAISSREVPETREHGRQPARDALLHPRERVPAALGHPLLPALGGVQLSCRSTVMGWWMVVTRGAPRASRAAQQPVPERLVVVHDVEPGRAGRADGGGRAARRRQRLRICRSTSSRLPARRSSRGTRRASACEGVGWLRYRSRLGSSVSRALPAPRPRRARGTALGAE